ncbi:MAG: hypothetical protein J1D86_07890 [Alistipes sp.]|nr:hypothetical protein [Alistipes sp.]
MKTVVLFPTEAEAAPLRRRASELDIRICGVGQARAAAAAARIIAAERPDRVILAGIAGTYDSSVALGSVYAVELERDFGLPARFAAEFRAGFLPDGLPRAVSNTVQQTSADGRGALIENMEGAAVYAVCAAQGVACCGIRAVSNRTGEPFGTWDVAGATDNLAEILIRILKS